MDLRLFHSDDSPKRSYKIMDLFNSWTGELPCHFLEWIGWYYGSIQLRLLGHYRLFQIFKKYHPALPNAMPASLRYILQRRIAFESKYHSKSARRYPEHNTEIYVINRMLLNDRSLLLQEFLINADADFKTALTTAVQQIHSPSFLGTPAPPPHPPTTDTLKGKEKGALSKKQVLILFDLLSQSTRLERFDLRNPNKHSAFAQFLFALTGKTKDSWLEELKEYRHRDLYEYHTEGERNQLTKTLDNLARILNDAGLKSLSIQADKKITELDAKARDKTV